MANARRYNTATYEKKLGTVMTRLGIDKFDYDYTRRAAWVTFTYKGQEYRFEHSIDSAAAHGHPLSYGSDAFCQIVLTLEDLARASNRGIYDLQTWVEGILKSLPCHIPVPDCFATLGLTQTGTTADDIQKAFRAAAMDVDQTNGAGSEEIRRLLEAKEECLSIVSHEV